MRRAGRLDLDCLRKSFDLLKTGVEDGVEDGSEERGEGEASEGARMEEGAGQTRGNCGNCKSATAATATATATGIGPVQTDRGNTTLELRRRQLRRRRSRNTSEDARKLGIGFLSAFLWCTVLAARVGKY